MKLVLNDKMNENQGLTLITIAVTENLNGDHLLLYLNDYNTLLQHSEVFVPNACVLSRTSQLVHTDNFEPQAELLERRILANIDAIEIDRGKIAKLPDLEVDFPSEKI